VEIMGHGVGGEILLFSGRSGGGGGEEWGRREVWGSEGKGGEVFVRLGVGGGGNAGVGGVKEKEVGEFGWGLSCDQGWKTWNW